MGSLRTHEDVEQSDDAEAEHRERGLVDEDVGGADVALGGAVEEVVEPVEEALEQAALAVGVARLEQKCGERGR